MPGNIGFPEKIVVKGEVILGRKGPGSLNHWESQEEVKLSLLPFLLSVSFCFRWDSSLRVC